MRAQQTPLVGSQGLQLIDTKSVPAGSATLTFTETVARGHNWTFQLTYLNSSQFLSSTSPTKAVQVP